MLGNLNLIWFLLHIALCSALNNTNIDSQISIKDSTIIQWNNENSIEQSLIIYDIQTVTKIRASQNLILPEDFQFDFRIQAYYPSTNEAFFYEYLKISRETSVKYIYLIGEELKSQGTLNTEQNQANLPFSVQQSIPLNEKQYENYSYLYFPSLSLYPEVYEIPNRYYSQTGNCMIVSPMSMKFWYANQCITSTPMSLLNTQMYRESYTQFKIQDQILQINLRNQDSRVNFNTLNISDNFKISPLQGNAQDFRVTAIWLNSSTLNISVESQAKQISFATISCIIKQVDYCNKGFVFKPSQTKVFTAYVPKHQESLMIKVSGRNKNVVASIPSIEYPIDNKNSQINTHQKVVKQIHNTNLAMIFTIISSVIVCNCMVSVIIFICKRSKLKKQKNQKKTPQSQSPEQLGKEVKQEDQGFKKWIKNNMDENIMPPTSKQEFIDGSCSLDKMRSYQKPEI